MTAGEDGEKAMLGEDMNGGNIYKFPQNRSYFDSLDSFEVVRDEQPQFVQQDKEESDHYHPDFNN